MLIMWATLTKKKIKGFLKTEVTVVGDEKTACFLESKKFSINSKVA